MYLLYTQLLFKYYKILIKKICIYYLFGGVRLYGLIYLGNVWVEDY